MCQCTWQRTGRRRSGDRASFALPPNVSRGPRKAEAADIVEWRAAAAAARIFQLLLPMPRPAKARVALNCYSPARCARQVSQSTAWEFFNTNPVARSVKMTRFGQWKRALGTIRLSNSRKYAAAAIAWVA